ncbi:ABC transporter substrate-binding protein [Aeromicrobium sp. YIM 150415]|uniref:ABC transporter substrate-binding protein n=1 Tax=Aeromicrobium sp. YIM 150415 TaxID=2803912 RepID=UPI0019629D25|nr:ABC transporter substrate-binding protein [Aeromicrobium sp. YIM 150415]MBM9465316.1 ABC transporter substrate-binding protein [Aeromicrobium sp. YIM 150415]
MVVRTLPTLAAAAAALLLAGCGADASGDSASDDTDGVSLTNCDIEKTYAAPVERIVATSNSANIGTLLRVGAVDQLAAVALNPDNDEIMTELYGSGIEDVPRLESPISLEAIVAQTPDLLIGSYSGLFAGSSGVTEEVAAERDIDTYVISDSCRQDPDDTSSALGTMDPWTAVRTDLENYGALTGHEDEASEAIEDLDERLGALEDAPRPDAAPKVLLFDSGTDDLYTSGHNGPPQGIIDAAGGENVFADEDTTWFRASWEAVASRQPDVIVVLDYRSGDENEVATKIDTIRQQPALRDLPAVAEDRIVVLPLALFTSGHPNIEAAEALRTSFDDLGLTPESGIEGRFAGYGR